MTKYVPYTWNEFCAKQDYEGTEYMMTQIDPEGVPAELRDAHAALQKAYNEWDAIVQANYAEYSEEDDT
jgi:hypothetical protein